MARTAEEAGSTQALQRVERFTSPANFARYQTMTEAHGFPYIASGPLVGSSNHAAEFFMRGSVIDLTKVHDTMPSPLSREAMGLPPVS